MVRRRSLLILLGSRRIGRRLECATRVELVMRPFLPLLVRETMDHYGHVGGTGGGTAALSFSLFFHL
jgi:hypothetical protein